ncbi:hypothetical protein HDV02_004623 [Globomyces sp. JEL0801]|nr:hypothetical protein HDV02_004623 [Globomyces sp. JEL0801]
MCGSKQPDGPPAAKNNTAAPAEAAKPTIINSAPAPKRVATKKFLDAILQSKELTAALESFLTTEFCIENLLFIQKCGYYTEVFGKSDLEKQEDRVKLAGIRDDIQKEFMMPTSEREVNIPAKVKRECLIHLELLKSKGLKMEAEEYSEIGQNVFKNCENYVKGVLVQERIGNQLQI